MTVLDPGVLADLARDLGDDDLVREVVRLFLDQLEHRRQAIGEAAAANDAARVRREAHTLGSASAVVGAVELRSACRRLEASELDEPPLATHPLVVAWATACTATETAVADWLAQPA